MAEKQVALRVVLNGAFLIVDDYSAPSIEVIIPDIGAEHSYVAGNFLAETALEQGKTYKLEGLDKMAGEAHFRHDINFVVSGKGFEPETVRRGRVYAQLTFPRPDKIYSTSPSLLKEGDFYPQKEHYPKGFKLPKAHSGLQIFDYYQPANGPFKLVGSDWNPTSGLPKDGFPALFVYADAATAVASDNHRIRAFNAALQLIQGFPVLQVSDSDQDKKPMKMKVGKDGDQPQPELTDLEKEGLFDRALRFARMGHAIRFPVLDKDPKKQQDAQAAQIFTILDQTNRGIMAHYPGCVGCAIVELNKSGKGKPKK